MEIDRQELYEVFVNLRKLKDSITENSHVYNEYRRVIPIQYIDVQKKLTEITALVVGMLKTSEDIIAIGINIA